MARLRLILPLSLLLASAGCSGDTADPCMPESACSNHGLGPTVEGIDLALATATMELPHDGPIRAGDSITVRYTVVNRGDTESGAWGISEQAISGLDHSYNVRPFDPLAPGEAVSVEARLAAVLPSAPRSDQGDVRLTVVFPAPGGFDNGWFISGDGYHENDELDVGTYALGLPVFTAELVGAPDTIVVGVQAEYTLRVTNTSQIPGEATIAVCLYDYDWGCNSDLPAVGLRTVQLDPGEDATITTAAAMDSEWLRAPWMDGDGVELALVACVQFGGADAAAFRTGPALYCPAGLRVRVRYEP